MKTIAIILIIFGSIGLLLSFMMYGDIGIAAGIASITSLISGIGFLQVNKQLNLKK